MRINNQRVERFSPFEFNRNFVNKRLCPIQVIFFRDFTTVTFYSDYSTRFFFFCCFFMNPKINTNQISLRTNKFKPAKCGKNRPLHRDHSPCVTYAINDFMAISRVFFSKKWKFSSFHGIYNKSGYSCLRMLFERMRSYISVLHVHIV